MCDLVCASQLQQQTATSGATSAATQEVSGRREMHILYINTPVPCTFVMERWIHSIHACACTLERVSMWCVLGGVDKEYYIEYTI